MPWFQGRICISTLGQRPRASAGMGAFTELFRMNRGDVGPFPKFTPSLRWANTSMDAVMQKTEEALKRMQTISIVFCSPPAVITQQITSFFNSSTPRDL